MMLWCEDRGPKKNGIYSNLCYRQINFIGIIIRGELKDLGALEEFPTITELKIKVIT